MEASRARKNHRPIADGTRPRGGSVGRRVAGAGQATLLPVVPGLRGVPPDGGGLPATSEARPSLARVQRSRVSGSKLPDRTQVVTRPGPLGNPFTHSNAEIAVGAFRLFARSAIFQEPFHWSYTLTSGVVGIGRSHRSARVYGNGVFDEVVQVLNRPNEANFAKAFTALASRVMNGEVVNIACWCALGGSVQCHANVIIELLREYLQREAA